MATVLDLEKAALKAIGVLGAGETATPEDAADAFDELNRMAGQWNAEHLLLYAQTRTVFPLVSGTNVYTVGTGGTVNTARPVFIDAVRFQDTSTTLLTEYPLYELTQDASEGLVLKTMTSPFPSSYRYNPTVPLGTLTLWPTPTSTSLQGVMYSAQVVPAFAALTTVVVLPPGYEELIVTNLAVRLAASYTRQVDPLLFKRAEESRAVAKRANIQMADLSFPADARINSGGAWSIYTGP